jgi:hypothetical protein
MGSTRGEIEALGRSLGLHPSYWMEKVRDGIEVQSGPNQEFDHLRRGFGEQQGIPGGNSRCDRT